MSRQEPADRTSKKEDVRDELDDRIAALRKPPPSSDRSYDMEFTIQHHKRECHDLRQNDEQCSQHLVARGDMSSHFERYRAEAAERRSTSRWLTRAEIRSITPWLTAKPRR